MPSIFKNFSYLSRVLHVISWLGNNFLNLTEFTSVVARFVFGYDSQHAMEDGSTFAAESASLLQLVPGLSESSQDEFKQFHDFTLECGHPMATIHQLNNS